MVIIGPTVFETLLSADLSETTRRERRSLLAISVVSIAITALGLVPTKFENLGIELTGAGQSGVLILLFTVVFYFLLTFTANAAVDFTAFLGAHRTVRTKIEEARERQGGKEWRNRLFLAACAVRALLDYGVPTVLSVLALVLLVIRLRC